MARQMAADDTEVFRAVITVVREGQRWTNGRMERTEVAGPYRTAGAAKSAIARARRENTSWRSARGSAYDETVTVTGRVERSAIAWEAVE